MKTKEPHHRRTHALMVASIIVAVIFVVWLITLPFRLQGPALPVSDTSGTTGGSNQTDLTAAAQNAPTDNSGAAQLQVSTTSVFQ